MMTKIGMYKIPDEDAEKLGYEVAYIIGEYKIDENNNKIIIARSVYDYYSENLTPVAEKDFEDISMKPMSAAKNLFKKYGAEVDVAFIARSRKGPHTRLIAIIGGKPKD